MTLYKIKTNISMTGSTRWLVFVKCRFTPVTDTFVKIIRFLLKMFTNLVKENISRWLIIQMQWFFIPFKHKVHVYTAYKPRKNVLCHPISRKYVVSWEKNAFYYYTRNMFLQYWDSFPRIPRELNPREHLFYSMIFLQEYYLIIRRNRDEY